ncbi:MAG: S8 family serine peptidase [Pseudomonadota bacterium]|nr:S8 family serine peptidase [Pseudomonadota bacterium]
MKRCEVRSVINILFLLILWSGSGAAVADGEVIGFGFGVADAVSQGGDPLVVIALVRPEPKAADRASINAAVASRQQDVLDTLNEGDYTLIHRYRSLAGLAMILHSELALRTLAAHPSVRRIDLDVGGSRTLDQSRPWVGADVAHAEGITGIGQTAAVLDTGIDTDHPDLMDDLVHEHCYCSTGTDCCPTGGNTGDGPGSAEDDNGHGTHVSGIITSSGGVAPLGIAPDAGIVAVKVLDQNGNFCCSADIAAALDWVLNNRPDVDVVNMSLSTFTRFSSDCDSSAAWTMVLADAVDALRTQGVLSIASSGNDSDKAAMGAPACLSGAVAVGATLDSSDLIASYSNSGPSLDLLAPGNSITSTMVGGGQTTLSGTSMAAPHVAALSTLISQQNPAATANEMAGCLATSPVQITDTNLLTRPRIDVPSALDACVPASGLALLPPQPGIAGQVNQFDVTGATPGGRVHYVYGFSDGSTPVPGCVDTQVAISNAKVFGSETADASGAASYSKFVPSVVSGREVLIQAVEIGTCTVSNRVDHLFP